MTRKKVKLAYITNDSARKATFKKRKKGLLKKVSELSTLCGVDACAIIYSPYDSHPEVWPSPLGAQRVLAQFRKMPEMEQSKKMVNQESFLRQRIAKATEQLKKQRKDNREREVTHVMFQAMAGKSMHGLNMMDLNDLNYMIDQNLREINKRIESLTKGKGASSSASASSSSTPAAATNPQQTGGTSMAGAGPKYNNGSDFVPQQQVTDQRATAAYNEDTMQRQQWLVDMLNSHEHVGFGGGDDIGLPFGDNSNHNPLWSNAFFP